MSDNVPNDPLFSDQWYLNNTGQFGGTPGVDLDVLPVWSDYTGKGVKVAVVDDGTQLDHPDLQKNIDVDDSYDAVLNQKGGNPVYADEKHGTAVAGIIAAAANNGIGGTGVAPDATLVIDRVALHDSSRSDFEVTPDNTQSVFVRAFTSALAAGADVINNSWGNKSAFASKSTDPSSLVATEAAAATTGRDGKGTILVFAEGNDRNDDIDGNLSNDRNGRFEIAVAATDNTGVVTRYSTPGANLLVSAPSNMAVRTELPTVPGTGITTTDRTGTDGYNVRPGTGGDYTYSFGGTSAATPEVSGVVALMLQANPNLGYRDVQQILAYSARITDPNRPTWTTNGANNWNGGGLHFSTDYGFGLVDARAAVRLAEAYQVLNSTPQTEGNLVTHTYSVLPSAAQAIDGVGVTEKFVISSGEMVNHVDLNLGMICSGSSGTFGSSTYVPGAASKLLVTLTSPDGTKVTMLSNPNNPGSAWPLSFTLGTDGFWGENSGSGTSDTGIWTLSIVNNSDSPSNALFTGASLSVEGSLVAQHQQFVYTDEYASTSAAQADRQDLNVATGNIADIDAAAVTGPVIVDLPGNMALIDHAPLAIQNGTVIGAVVTGDGNDTIIGDDYDHTYDAGRGSNTIVMGNGDDTVVSIGTDRIVAGAGSSSLQMSGTSSTITGGSGALSINDLSGHQTSVSGGAGAITITGGNGGSYTLSSTALVDCSGGGAADTISASGSTTVLGGAGTTVSNLGSGTLQFIAGAGDTASIDAQSGNTTVFGSAGSNVQFTGRGMLVAGSGNETLDGSASRDGFTGFVSNHGVGGGSEIIGGTGADVLVAGSGVQTLGGGSGDANQFVLAANGTLGSASITISDFGAAKGNLVELFGYGASEIATTLATAKTVGGTTSVSLGDGSKVTFLNVASLNSGDFFGG